MSGGITWIMEGPVSSTAAGSGPAPAVAGVKPRRAHTKSRKGCSTCKSRRKKCDEQRPECAQCLRKGIRCHYPGDDVHQEAGASTSLSRGQSQYSMARQNARDDIAGILQLLSDQNSSPTTPASNNVDVLRILDHFMNEKHAWIGTPATQKVLQQHGTRIGVDVPHLLHAIVSFSAAHLDHLHPDPALRVTAMHHFGRLVGLYAEDIKRLEASTVNEFFGTCIMLTMLSYLIVGYDPPKSTSNPYEQTCNWDAFRSMGGVRFMFGNPEFYQQLGRGVWGTLLQEVEEKKAASLREYVPTPAWWSKIILGLCDICDVPPDLRDGDSIYLEPLRGLNRIVQGSLDDTKVGQMMHFIGDLSSEFSELLERYEPKAMLIILYWHTLLMLIGQWWTNNTGMVSVSRGISYLWEVGGRRMRTLLVFPAAVCGFDLQSLVDGPEDSNHDPPSVSRNPEGQNLAPL